MKRHDRDRDPGQRVAPEPSRPATPIGQPFDAGAGDRAARGEHSLAALRRYAEAIALIRDIAIAANEARSTDDAVRTALARICTHTSSSLGHVYVRRGGEPDLESSGIWHVDGPDRYADFRAGTERTRFAPGEDLPGQVLRSGKSAWMMDLAHCLDFDRGDLAARCGLRTGIAVPVLAGKEVCAVLEFFARDALPRDLGLLEILTQIGTLLGEVYQRIQSREALRNKTAVLEATLENIGEGICMVDENLGFVAFNRRFLELRRVPEGAVVVGTRLDEYFRLLARRGDLGPGAPEELVRQRLELARQPEPHCFERRLPDGRVLEVRGNPILGGGLVYVYTDITERKRSAQARAESEERTRLLLDSAGEGIYGVDRDGGAVFVNPAAARLLGYDVDELIGQPMHEKIHPTTREGFPCPKEACPICAPVTDGAVHHTNDDVLWRKDGTCFSVEYTSTPVRKEREVVGAVVMFQDITERKSLEAQLLQAQKLESIGRLAAGVAHEINTPTQYVGDNIKFLDDAFSDLLSAHEAYTALLRAATHGDDLAANVARTNAALEPLDIDFLLEEIPKAIAQSGEGVERIARIVQAMKEFSYPGGAQKELVDLNKVIANTVTVARSEWKYVANVVTHFDETLPPIPGHAAELGQVFLNLIVNAAHAIDDSRDGEAQGKGTISLSTKTSSDSVEVRIADTGPGIPEAIVSKIFDPFFTTKAIGRGTGQGLAIAHAVIVEKHGGAIEVESRPGEGTTFIVCLPVDEASGRRTAAA